MGNKKKTCVWVRVVDGKKPFLPHLTHKYKTGCKRTVQCDDRSFPLGTCNGCGLQITEKKAAK